MLNRQPRQNSPLIVQKVTSESPNINPKVITGKKGMRRKTYSVDEYLEGILTGNRTILSQAITLTESTRREHYDTAQLIIEKCLPYSAKSLRIGITGVPGAGKSTFIETFGMYLTGLGRKLAVLTIDPSSGQTKGSILGDKTRMEKLSVNPYAYIRPSPSAGTLGGVARKTRETIILCEAAGFDTILVETVGVGQSETEVHSMVDLFLLLMLAGAGDEIQGMKRGIMEMADLVAITKADGPNKLIADGARVTYQNAINLFPPAPSGWKPQVVTCSAKENNGIAELWEIISDYEILVRNSGYFEDFRREQAVIRMHNTISEYLQASFYNNEEVKMNLPAIERQLSEGRITSYSAAISLVNKYLKMKD